MFTFGLFSTHMPYVVMVAVSAFYFLFSSPAFNKTENQAKDQQVSKTELSATEDSNNHTPAAFIFAGLIGQDNTSARRLTPVRHLHYTPPEDRPPGPGIYFTLFSRPPPSVA